VAGAGTEDRTGPSVAQAPQLPWRTGPEGYIRARVAGGAGRAAVSDSHDRRRDQRVNGAVCPFRFHRGEHAAALALSGVSRPSGGVLHGQGESVPDGAQGRAGSEPDSPRRAGTAAADPDRPGFTGTGYRLDRGPLAAGQRARGTKFWHGTGPAWPQAKRHVHLIRGQVHPCLCARGQG
jgi:hypothetical protein